MSGKKQHYIPQCLLRGFEASRSGKGPQVIVFKRDRHPYTSLIEDVAAQRYFYSKLSKDGRKTLDDQITEYENRLGPLLRELRTADSGAKVDPSLAAEVVAHLTIRTAFVRDLFGFGIRELLASAATFFADSEAVRQYLGIDAEEPNAILTNEIDQVLDRFAPTHLSPAARSILTRVSLFWLRESFTENYGKNAGEFTALLASMGDALPALARSGHAKALISSVVPDLRVKALADLTWTCIRLEPGAHFVLPDCVAISRLRESDGGYVPYFLTSNEELATVLVPLSSSQLLIGSHNAVAPETDPAQVNRAAAMCAFDFFVSSIRNDETCAAAKVIGIGSRHTILTTVRDSVSHLAAPSDNGVHSAPTYLSETGSGAPEDEAHRGHSYVVSFLDCADRAAAERIAGVVRIVVDALGRRMPVHRIESVTFASDYEKALAEIDRGFQASTPLTPTSTPYGEGIAMVPMVLRDDGIRCCIVMRSWLGHALVSADDDTGQRMAVHTLATMVARAAYIDLVDKALPGILLKPLEDPWDAFFMRYIESVSSSYFSARVVADIHPELGDGYQDLFRDALKSALERIPLARIEYRTHGDLDTFIPMALSLLSDVLTHAATAMGHFDALDMSMTEDVDTKNLLLEHGLLGWIDVYQRDLEAVYDKRGKWRSLKDFLSLAVHLERLLWQFGVFPCKTDGNKVRIEIPIEVDMATLLKGVQSRGE